MALTLPFVQVDRRKRLISESRDGTLTKRDRTLLLNLDWDLARSDSVVGDRMVPLGEDRWAVGRGVANGTVYRIVEFDKLADLKHPAWLWTDESWFTVKKDTGPSVQTLPLKRTLRQAARLVTSTRTTGALLAAVIAHLRRKERRPLAIIADETHLRGPGDGARWFTLALVSCLPLQMSMQLRLAGLEPRPDPKLWDLVFSTEAPHGFDVMDAQKPPDTLGDDVVAFYIRKRLMDGEPELVEAIAPLWDEGADDPWGSCLERMIQEEGPAGLAIDRETLQEQFPVAHKLTLTRLRGGAKMTGRLAGETAAVTAKSGDPELWKALTEHSEADRARVFAAWLAIADKYPPDDPLLEAIGTVRPPRTQTNEWLSALLRWLALGKAPMATPHLIRRTLEQDPEDPDLPSRASAFFELIHALVKADRPVDALSSLFSPAGRLLAGLGGGRTLVHCWLVIPKRHRTETALNDLIGLIGAREDAGQGAWFLWRDLQQTGQDARAAQLLVQWASHRAQHPPQGHDQVMESIMGTPHAETWVRAAASHTSHRNLPALLRPVISSRKPDLWLIAEESWAAANKPISRDRFVGLAAFLPDGARVFAQPAIHLLGEALPTTPFPDPQIAEVASLFAEAPEPSPIWMWVAVTASAPEQFDEGTVDATVHAFCGVPPRRNDERQLAQALARRLGFANEWTAFEHARWVVRLLLAPDGDSSGFPHALALSMMQSMLKRADGLERVTSIGKAIFELPPDHPALRFFIEDVLPRLWGEGPPKEFMDAVQVHKQPTEIRSVWRQAFGTL